NEILSAAAKERSVPGSQDVKSGKVPSFQQRSQLEELRKFGKEFRLQPSSSPSSRPSSVDPLQNHPTPPIASSPPKPTTSRASPVQDPAEPTQPAPPCTSTAALTPQTSAPDRPQAAIPPPVPATSGEELPLEGGDMTEAASAVSSCGTSSGSSRLPCFPHDVSGSLCGRPPPVASPYPQSYLQYGQVIQAMPPHYHGQPVYSMLQGGARMLTSGAPHQTMAPPGPPYQTEGPPGPQQTLFARRMEASRRSSTRRPSPGHAQSSPAAPQPQAMFHSGALAAPTPPNLPPGHSSPQASFMQGYNLPAHQPLPHAFPAISQLTQAHVQTGMSGPHHSAAHGPPPVMLHYAPPQQGSSSTTPAGGAAALLHWTPSSCPGAGSSRPAAFLPPLGQLKHPVMAARRTQED
ncbi:unnamed protein product, partial [Lampetra planeri]